MATMDHALDGYSYDQSLYGYSAASYRPTHHQYGHQATPSIPAVSPMSSASAHQRRDSNVGMGIDHSQAQAQFPHPSHSPPLSRQQQHHQHAHQAMSSRPRSTSAVTIDTPGSTATMLHDSRPRAHSYADPRAAADQRAKHHIAHTPSLEEIVFPTTPGGQELDEEPLYVNAKQYHRILKRRIARARLQEIQKQATQRKPYLHQSRHNHAVRRPRGPGGRFLTAEEIAARKIHEVSEGIEKGSSDGSPAQESTSSPGEEVGSPTRTSLEKQPNSATSASSGFSYPSATTTLSPAEFGGVSLGSILTGNASIGLNGSYDYGTVAGAE